MLSCKCQDCGSEFLFSNRILEACLVCGNKSIVNTNKNYNIPSKKLGKSTVSKDEFMEKVDYILREGNYTPDDIIEQTKIYECIKLYVPYYKYSVSYHCTFNCSVGYDKKVDYTDYEIKRDENGKEYKEPVHKQRTETYWQPYSGEFDGAKSFYHIASNRFYEIKDFIQEVTQCNYVYVDSNNISENVVVEKIEFSAKRIFEERCESALKNYVSNEAEKMAPGDHLKNLRYSFNYSLDSNDIKFELIWVALCNYKGQFFRIFSDANNTEAYKTVGKPVDNDRINLVENIEKPLKYIKPLFTISLIITILSGLLSILSFVGKEILFFTQENWIVEIILIAFGSIFSLFFSIIKRNIRNKRDSIINKSKMIRGLI